MGDKNKGQNQTVKEILGNNIQDIMKHAVEYQAISIRERGQTCETYRQKESDLHNSFRVSLDGLIVRAINQLSNKIEETTDKISYQISLAISFVRTHFIINDLILNGDLIEASTLIRKNFESVTRLHEIDNSPLQKLLKKTPNVFNIFGPGARSLYPDLSEIAHFATPGVGELLTVKEFNDGRIGPSIYPTFNEQAQSIYDRHAFISIYFVFWLISFLESIYEKGYDSTNDKMIFTNVIGFAEEAGIIKKEVDPESKTK